MARLRARLAGAPRLRRAIERQRARQGQQRDRCREIQEELSRVETPIGNRLEAVKRGRELRRCSRAYELEDTRKKAILGELADLGRPG